MGNYRQDVELAREKISELAPNWDRIHDWLFINKSYLLRQLEFIFEFCDVLDSLGYSYAEMRLAMFGVFEERVILKALGEA